jgi:hypothetical protein
MAQKQAEGLPNGYYARWWGEQLGSKSRKGGRSQIVLSAACLSGRRQHVQKGKVRWLHTDNSPWGAADWEYDHWSSMPIAHSAVCPGAAMGNKKILHQLGIELTDCCSLM